MRDDPVTGLLIKMAAGGVIAVVGLLILQSWASYSQARSAVAGQRGQCERSLFNTVEGLDGDLRVARFFHDASVARRASGTALDIETADSYLRLSEESKRAAARRNLRTLGVDKKIVRMTVRNRDKTGRIREVPAPEAVAEVRRACTRVNPAPSFFFFTTS